MQGTAEGIAWNLEGATLRGLKKFLEKGLIKQIRISVPATYRDEKLREIIDGHKTNSTWATKIKLVKEVDQSIPFVVDTTFEELAKAEAISRRALFWYGPTSTPQYWHRKITDFIKEV